MDDYYEVVYEGHEYHFKTKKFWTHFASGSDYVEEYFDEINTALNFEFKTPVFSGNLEDFVEKYTGKNLEFQNDDTDHFRKTVIQIEWKSDKDYLKTEEESGLSQELLKVVNQFIEIYRSSSGEYHLPLLKELPYRTFSVITNTDTGKSSLIYHVNVKKAGYNISKNQHDEFKNKLKSHSKLSSAFLSLNAAKHWHSRGQYRNSILEAVIAIEPIVQKSVEVLWERRALSKTQTKNQLSKIDLNYMMYVEIPNLLDLRDRKIRQQFDQVISTVNLRNKIVHKNLSDITKEQSSTGIESVEGLMNILSDYCNTEGV